jgi:hypothetical protein
LRKPLIQSGKALSKTSPGQVATPPASRNMNSVHVRCWVVKRTSPPGQPHGKATSGPLNSIPLCVYRLGFLQQKPSERQTLRRRELTRQYPRDGDKRSHATRRMRLVISRSASLIARASCDIARPRSNRGYGAFDKGFGLGRAQVLGDAACRCVCAGHFQCAPAPVRRAIGRSSGLVCPNKIFGSDIEWYSGRAVEKSCVCSS